VTDRECT